MGLFQIAKCAQNHLLREQPAPARKSGPTAIALLLLSLCTPADAPAHTPGRTISSTPGPFAPRCPKKVPPSRVTRSRPCPIQPHAGPVSSQCLRHFSPRIRPNPAISPPSIAICAHACYHLSREGPTPRLGSPTPNRALGPGIRRGIPCGCPGDSEGTAGRPRSVPLSSSATRRDICAPNCPSQHYRIAQHRRHSQLRDAQNVAETNRFRLPAFTGTTALGRLAI